MQVLIEWKNLIYICVITSFAGINPQSLRGSETGVYIGFTTIGMPDGIPEEIQPDVASSIRDSFLLYPGNGKTMYPNRISYVFDFKGPSIIMDTACSSSMVALDVAITDLRLGNRDSVKRFFWSIKFKWMVHHFHSLI